MNKPVILTGIRANNDLTLGNYFGGLLPIIDMAKNKSDDYQVNLFVPDLHSFTTPIDHSQLQAQIWNNLRIFVAAGLPLNLPDVHLYRQSYVSAHSELTWILDCFSGFGELSRMTEFKSKAKLSQIELVDLNPGIERTPANEAVANFSRQIEEHTKKIQKILSPLTDKERFVGVGLFNYPVLMTADILLYNATYVPVGDDQTQHLEFTRNIAERLNKRFGDIFTVPLPVKKQHEFFGNDQGLRIKDLADPTKKMSKSDASGKGVIFLSDDPKVSAKKIMGATTDDFALIDFNRETQPGISNLLEILALLRAAPLETVIEEFRGGTRYGDFKRVVANELEVFLTDFQARLAQVDDVAIQAKLEQSEAVARETANATLLRAQKAVGLR